MAEEEVVDVGVGAAAKTGPAIEVTKPNPLPTSAVASAKNDEAGA